MTKPLRMVFMGSPDFAVQTLEALAGSYHLVGVVTQPDRPAGRGRVLVPPPVKITALRLGVPVMQPEKIRLPDAMARLQSWAPDLIIVAAFGQILRQPVLDLPGYGCINVHGSILPRGRGAAPIHAAILEGDGETGITIMKMDLGVDTGPIITQRSIPISPVDTTGSLSGKLAFLGAELLLETLPRYVSGDLVPRPQSEEGATYTPMLKKEDGLLNFDQSAVALERRVRAMQPWPGTYFDWNGSFLKVHQVHVGAGSSPGAGHRFILEGYPAIGTGEGILILEKVQPAGRKSMSGKAFLSGIRGWV